MKSFGVLHPLEPPVTPREAMGLALGAAEEAGADVYDQVMTRRRSEGCGPVAEHSCRSINPRVSKGAGASREWSFDLDEVSSDSDDSSSSEPPGITPSPTHEALAQTRTSLTLLARPLLRKRRSDRRGAVLGGDGKVFFECLQTGQRQMIMKEYLLMRKERQTGIQAWN
eukprot:762060-Hanusia_phi.AAC.2